MKTDELRKKAAVSLAVLCLNLIASLIYVLNMPAKVPVSFDSNMICDRIGSRWNGMIVPVLMPVILAVLYILGQHSKNKEKNRRMLTLWMIICTFITVLIGWFVLFIMNSGRKTGDQLDGSIMWMLPAVTGVLFIVIGNYLPTLRQNKLIGYRIDWTLNNEQCWKLTHQFAGKFAFVTGGIMLLSALVMKAAGVYEALAYSSLVLILMMPIVFAPLVYAYIHRNDS